MSLLCVARTRADQWRIDPPRKPPHHSIKGALKFVMLSIGAELLHTVMFGPRGSVLPKYTFTPNGH
jgi:hypothetical protein